MSRELQLQATGPWFHLDRSWQLEWPPSFQHIRHSTTLEFHVQIVSQYVGRAMDWACLGRMYTEMCILKYFNYGPNLAESMLDQIEQRCIVVVRSQTDRALGVQAA